MPAYPTTPAYKSTVKPISRTRFKTTESGKARGNNLAGETLYRITVEHPFITSSQVTTLQTFYDTNKDADNTITANDGRTYDVNFESDFTFNTTNQTYFTAKTTLIGNRQ